MIVRCPECGRFTRWDAYRAVWYCDRDERAIPPKPMATAPARPPGWRPVGASLVRRDA